jgi:6-phosphofructokinase 1
MPRRLGVDAMIVTGGDGTQHIARDFFTKGVNVVGAPKTIDNDLDATEVTFGFDTAVVIATEAIDRLHTTAESHHRAMLIEVMGRDAGWIALHDGIGGGAHIILVPEIPFKFEAICDAVRARKLRGKRFSLIVVAESVKMPTTDPSGKPIPAVGPGGVANSIVFTLREMPEGNPHYRSRPSPAWWLPDDLRSHPRHSLRRRRHRFGRQWTIWPHGLPQGW